MHRRTILHAAVAAVTLPVAGCVGNGPDGSGPDDPDGTGDGSDGTAGGSDETDDGDGDAPTLVDATLDRRGDCSDSGATATVAFDAETVTVDGCLEASNGCVYPELADAEYADGAFVVSVEGVDESDPDEMCTQAIEYRAYEVAATFDGSVPATVEVHHDGQLVTEARPE